MNKIYSALLIVLLSGCHQYTLEEIVKARKYCEAYNTKLKVGLNGMQEVRWIGCVSSEEAVFDIPKEALK